MANKGKRAATICIKKLHKKIVENIVKCFRSRHFNGKL